MKKLLLLIFLIPLLSGSPGKVYICTGKYAKAYHKTTTCRGIKSCKGDIKSISLEEAIKMKRTPCGYCY